MLDILFTLFTKCQDVTFGNKSFAAAEIAVLHNSAADYPASVMHFEHVRLDVHGAVASALSLALHVYTNSSYVSHAVGEAYAMFDTSRRIIAVGRFRMEGATDSYSAEIVTFAEAVVCISGLGGMGPVCFHTGSLSLLMALGSLTTSDARVARIKQALTILSERRSVSLFHVPGHSGIVGNELTDVVASRAHRSSCVLFQGVGQDRVSRGRPCQMGTVAAREKR